MTATSSRQDYKSESTTDALESANTGRRTRLGMVLRSLRQDKGALFGATILIAIILFVLAFPLVSDRSPTAPDPANGSLPPLSPGYILGSDQLGRDIMTRIAYGGRVSLIVAIVPVVTSLVLGVFLGLVAGYFGGFADSLIMRSMDVLLAIPALLFAIGIAAALGPSMRNLIIALLVVGVPSFARIVRSQVLQVRETDYVLASRAIGQTQRGIILRHVLPNVLAPVIVFATLQTGLMIILAAGLSFLGLGVQPPTPDWGVMLAQGRPILSSAPHVATVPGLVIFAVVIGLNLLGDGLRDALDPRLTGS
jgi:peptide/nickel transport system permease protein